MGRFEEIQFGRINKTCLFISILIIIYMGTASARRQGRGCTVERCHHPYAKAMERLKSRGPSEVRECKANLRYQKCLSRMRRSCRGHLLFHSIEHMNQNTLKRLNCTAVLAEHEKLMAMSSHAENITHVPNSNTAAPITTQTVRENSACIYKGKPTLKQCQLWDNSEIQRYSGELITCFLEGTWSLVDNDYLVVSVTFVREPTEPRSYASKVSVLVRSAGECSQKKMYIATNADVASLPSAFTDGSMASGSVEVVEMASNRHVEIRARFINTTVTLRLLNSRLTVGVRMPDEFTESLKTRNQLCGQKHLLLPAVKPKSTDSLDSGENNGEIPRRRQYTHSNARQKCKKIMCNTSRKIAQKPHSKTKKPASAKLKNTQADIAQLILSKQAAKPVLVPKKRQKRGKEQKHRRCSQFKHKGNFKICFDTCVSDLVNFGRMNLTLIKNWLNNNSLPDDSSSLDYGNDVVPLISSDCSNTVAQNANRSNSSGLKLASSSIFSLFSYFLYFIVLYLQM